jgi:hypothetical protein
MSMLRFVQRLGERLGIKRVPRWDVFVSHASEDKQRLAAPLALSLRRAGFSVWFDEFTLKSGDDFLKLIDLGLRESACGLLIISPRYVEKTFTNYEIARILAAETSRGIKIIPLRSDLTVEDISKRYPALKSRLILDLDKEGVDYIAGRIATDLLADADLPAAQIKSLPRRFGEVLGNVSEAADAKLPGRLGITDLHRTASAVRIAQFLHNYPEILITAYGKASSHCLVYSHLYPELGATLLAPERRGRWLDDADYFAQARQSKLNSDFDIRDGGGTYTEDNHLLVFGADQDLLSGHDRDRDALKGLMGALGNSDRERSEHKRFTIVAGRRAQRGTSAQAAIDAFNRSNRHKAVVLRSHDWLLDACDTLWSYR